MTRPLVIACAALASDLRAVLSQFDGAVDVTYLPAPLHNRPEQIVPAIQTVLADAGSRPVVVGYGDCGTGGALDHLLDHERAEGRDIGRLPGDHCYEIFAGSHRFAALHASEPGTFYLTDFLAKHFEALVWQGLGLDRHPELRDTYFAHYRRVVLLSQSDDPVVEADARRAADRLGLVFEHVHVGRAALSDAVEVTVRGRAA